MFHFSSFNSNSKKFIEIFQKISTKLNVLLHRKLWRYFYNSLPIYKLLKAKTINKLYTNSNQTVFVSRKSKPRIYFNIEHSRVARMLAKKFQDYWETMPWWLSKAILWRTLRKSFKIVNLQLHRDKLCKIWWNPDDILVANSTSLRCMATGHTGAGKSLWWHNYILVCETTFRVSCLVWQRDIWCLKNMCHRKIFL